MPGDAPVALQYAIGVMLGGGWIGLGYVVRLVLAGKLTPAPLIEAKDRELDAIKAERIEERRQFTVLAAETVPTLNGLVAAMKVATGRPTGPFQEQP